MTIVVRECVYILISSRGHGLVGHTNKVPTKHMLAMGKWLQLETDGIISHYSTVHEKWQPLENLADSYFEE